MTGGRVMIGEVLRAHGVRGGLRVRPTGATLAGLQPGEPLVLVLEGGRERLVAVRGVQGGPVLELEGVDDREGADQLRGARIEVPQERLSAPRDPDEFYVRDLVGCEVLVGDRPEGRVVQVHERPANDVLEVSRAGGDPLLLPFTHDAVLSVDLAARRIVVRGDLLGPDA